MFGDDEGLVEDGVLVRRNVEAATVQLVRVVAHADVVTHANGRIVHQTPAGAPHCQTQRQLPVHLRTLAAQSLVEADSPHERQAKGAVRAFQHVHVARRTHAQVVIPDRAAEPLKPADVGLGTARVGLLVAAPHATDIALGLEPSDDALEPVRIRLGVVVGECDDVAVGRGERSVHRGNHPGSRDKHGSECGPGGSALEDKRVRFSIVSAQCDDHRVGRTPLLAQRRETAVQIAMSAIARNDGGDLHEKGNMHR